MHSYNINNELYDLNLSISSKLNSVLSQDLAANTIPVDIRTVLLEINGSAPIVEMTGSRSVYPLSDFIDLDGDEFIRTVYLRILGREPDPSGKLYYSTALCNNRLSKTEIVVRLYLSPEGRARKIRIRNWLVKFLVENFFKVPILGYFSRTFLAVANLPNIIKTITSLAHRISFLEKSEAKVDNEIETLRLKLREMTSLFLMNNCSTKKEFNSTMQREFKNDFLELKVSLNSLSEKVSVLQDGDNAGKAELANFKIFVNQFTKKVSDYDAALVDKNRALEGFLQRLNKCEASVLENHTELELFAPLKNNFDKNLEKVQEFDKFLERFYSYYYRKVVDPSYIKEKFKNYLPFLHKDMDILDVACGRGEFLEVLKENGFTSAMGVDISKEFVKTNLNNGLTVVCESWDTYLACHRQEFDVITSFQFLEHLEITEIVDFLNKALLALKPKGILIVEFPNIESLTVGCNQFYLDVTHKSKINKTLFWHLSEFIGFDVVEEKNLTMLSALSEVEDKVINDNFMRLSHDIYGYFDKAFILRKNTDD